MLGGEFAGLADGAIGAVVRIGIDNVCSVNAQNLLAFGGNVLRHAERYGKSLSRAQHGIGNAGVAAGGVKQSSAGSELTAAAAFGNDVGRGAVFHGTAGV